MKNLIFKISICLFAFLMSYKAFAGDTIYSLPKVAYVEYATGFSKPTDIANAGDGRLFIVEAKGNIKIINANGTTNPTVFMKVPSVNSSGNEQGLLGLAFHPNYASNKQFYVNYIRGSGNGNTQISRFTTSSTNPDTASVSSKFDILTFPQPYANHNGGDLNFGPDGFLYIGTGDGGLANDPEENGQKKKSLLGKMLRIDINSGSPYSIPSTNPFASNTDYLPEIWALGLRNPWRVSFDRQTGDLYIADVGQNLWEEVDFVPAGSAGGMNFGWDCWEGNHVLEPAGCGPMSSFQFPVFEYTHGSECSITGGFVYRGNNYPRMKGNYICADYCSGATYMLTKNTDATFKSRKFANIGSMITFGENNNGELFAGNENGKIYRVIDTCNNFFATKTIQQACSGVNGSIRFGH
jgi:glucose/arabinose dehydrogenase